MAIDKNRSDTPRFAVVGRVNKGKSSILATLVEEADNARIRISEIPGETTRCNSIPLVLNGETLIEFIDTPGFSRARQALAWLQENHSEDGGEARIDTVRRFVEAHRDGDEFVDECLLLQPVLDGAGIVYVVDASKPFRPDFSTEMEILRWTGRPRMAVMNAISGETDFSEEWRERLGEFFNLTREFNAHAAQFRERIRLLRNLLEIEEGNRSKIEKTIELLEREWDQRRSEAADIMVDLLEKALTRQVCKNVTGERVDRDYKREQVERELKEKYRKDLRKLEAKRHRRLVELYRHSDAEFVGTEEGDLVSGEDLFAEETWQFLGLRPGQLALAGGLAGVAAGGTVDLATGGATAGFGALIGGAGGLLATWWKGKNLAEIKISNPLSVTGESSAGGVQLCAGPPRNPNFPWVLLDRILFHFEHLVTRSHGRRDRFVIDFSVLREGEGKHHGYASRISGSQRRSLQRWFSAVSAKGRENVEDGELFETLRGMLREIEEGNLRVLTGEGESGEKDG